VVHRQSGKARSEFIHQYPHSEYNLDVHIALSCLTSYKNHRVGLSKTLSGLPSDLASSSSPSSPRFSVGVSDLSDFPDFSDPFDSPEPSRFPFSRVEGDDDRTHKMASSGDSGTSACRASSTFYSVPSCAIVYHPSSKSETDGLSKGSMYSISKRIGASSLSLQVQDAFKTRMDSGVMLIIRA